MGDESRACPACGESIMAAAVICRFCKTPLQAPGAPAVAPPPKKKTNTTLIVLIVVGAVLVLPCIFGVLAALLLPAITRASQQAKITVCRHTLKGLTQSIRMHEIDLNAYPPSGNAPLVKALRSAGAKAPYYEFQPEELNSAGEVLDPWSRPFVYVNNVDKSAPPGWTPRDANSFDLYSIGPNGIDERGGGDDVSDRE